MDAFMDDAHATRASGAGSHMSENSPHTPHLGENSPPTPSTTGSTMPQEGQEYPVDEGEQVLLRKRSNFWDHYAFYRVMHKGHLKLRARCTKCNKSSCFAEGSDGTGNASRHIKVCKGILAVPSSPYDHETYLMMYAQAIICHAYPLNIVEHEYLRKLHHYLNPNVRHVCRNTILKYCVAEYVKFKSMLLDTLCDDVAGRISFTCDLWSACTNRGYLTLTAHYVDKHWVLRSKILNFRYCEPPHCAGNVKNFVLNLIKDWKLEGKAQSMTCDNARYMDNMVDLLQNDLNAISPLPCAGKYFHVRCCAHVLNLIVQSGLKCVDSSVSKLRKLIIYIDGSDGRLTLFELAVTATDSDFKCKLMLDVPTRWNSTYMMLHRALQARAPLMHFAARNMNQQDCLTHEEWNTIQNTCDFLEPFYDITELFSGSQYPTANLYFVNIALIENMICKGHLVPELHDMAASMLDKFEKYWADYSVILSIAVILDPRYKLKIVTNMYEHLYATSIHQEKVNVVRQALDELYAYYYLLSAPTNGSVQASSMSMSDPRALSLSRPLKKSNLLQNFEAQAAASRSAQSEIDCYLNAPLAADGPDFDVLKFWQNQILISPVLAIMARDILAIPITSVASESAFSMGARTLNKYRASLLPKNVEALVTTQNWLQGYEEQQPEDDLLVLELSKTKN